MIHGVLIEKGLEDWQIIQHKDGFADITVSGSWILTQDAIDFGFVIAEPYIRVLMEEDGSQVIPWQKTARTAEADGTRGTWSATLTLPAGGLYRLETGLHTVSSRPGLVWLFRGDTRLHFGVGDVFLIAGQSNSAGYGKDSAYDPPELGVHIFRNRRSWDIASHPLNEASFNAGAPNADAGVCGTSPYLSFGKTLRRLSHYPVGLVATAKGGMSIKKWTPPSGSLYKNMLEQAKVCGPIAGVLWYQGCSDTNAVRSAQYKERYYNFIRAFREDLGYPVRFFTYQLNREVQPEYKEGYGIVREIQRMAAHDFEEVYVMPTLDCRLSDGIHNSAHSCVQLGERMARLCAHVLYQTPAYAAPEIVQAKASDDGLSVTLFFSNMQLGFIIPADQETNCGFTLHDADGNRIPYQNIKHCSEGNCLQIPLDAPLPKGSTVSFAWEGNPTASPVLDEVTYLPPIAFYKYPIER